MEKGVFRSWIPRVCIHVHARTRVVIRFGCASWHSPSPDCSFYILHHTLKSINTIFSLLMLSGHNHFHDCISLFSSLWWWYLWGILSKYIMKSRYYPYIRFLWRWISAEYIKLHLANESTLWGREFKGKECWKLCSNFTKFVTGIRWRLQ